MSPTIAPYRAAVVPIPSVPIGELGPLPSPCNYATGARKKPQPLIRAASARSSLLPRPVGRRELLVSREHQEETPSLRDRDRSARFYADNPTGSIEINAKLVCASIKSAEALSVHNEFSF